MRTMSPRPLLVLAVFAVMLIGVLEVTVVHSRGGVTRFSHSTPLHGLEVTLRGDVEFTDDDRGIRRLSPGGWLEIEERKGFHRRSLRVEADGAGELEYRYREAGKTVPFDADAQAWLAERLPQVIRESGIGAEHRVARILAQAGVAGLLDEIDLIDSSGARTRYAIELLGQSRPKPHELRRLAELASAIPSSGDKARFLIHAAERYLAEPDVFDAYIDAVDSIASSGDHARVLRAVLEADRGLEASALAAVLRSAGGIASSGDKSRVLISAARSYIDRKEVRGAFFDSAGSVPSSGDHARVLLSLLERDDLDRASLRELFESAHGIASSGDRTRVLLAAAGTVTGDDELVNAYLEVVETIPSAGDQRRALSALVR